MEIQATVTVPRFTYDIYAAAAEELKDYTVEQVMSSALHAYAQYLYEEMRNSSQLTDDSPMH